MIPLKQQVETILNAFPETRNDDVELLWKIREHYHWVSMIINKEKYKDIPKHTTVKRIRANFNSKWQYLPTKRKVIKKRRLQEHKCRELYSSDDMTDETQR